MCCTEHLLLPSVPGQSRGPDPTGTRNIPTFGAVVGSRRAHSTVQTQPSLPAPTGPASGDLAALGVFPLCYRSLFNLPELYLKDMESCRKILGREKM